MSAFRDMYNVAAIDMRGYGRSDRPVVRYAIECQNSAHHDLMIDRRGKGYWHFLPGCHHGRKDPDEGHAVVAIAGTAGLLY